jgi:chromatin segregation and condensation protein Rec8/ScpA/Scc1 (kleisin family)
MIIEKSLKLKRKKLSIVDRLKAFNKRMKLENEMLERRIKQARKENSKIKNLMWDILFVVCVAELIIGIILLALIHGGVI